ncbi:MAG: 50S ribosomal protein L4 [Candidatus Omnitrophica bacterium]|nr:50S ribosomal protein L4 [Candidatus Omnitrophota bacterium]
MFTLTVYNHTGKEIGSVDLNERVFDGQVNEPLLHQVVVMYEANQRQGTVSTKKRGEVSGGNSKPWRQKGTGRARHGSSRSPLWRKGGVVFGPRPRDYSYDLPKKVKRGALISSLNARLNENLVRILELCSVDSGKTRDFVKIMKALNISEKTLLVCEQPQQTLLRASRNVPVVQLARWQDINALDVLRNGTIIFTSKALEQLTERLAKGVEGGHGK